ncbi:MAG: prepilin peptidase [Actinomycetota bacterium]
MSQTLLMILAVPVGLLAGSYATMLVDRMQDDTPLSVRSRCPNCGGPLGLLDTLPVLSWVRLGGQCRECGERITPAYPAVELVTMALFVFVAYRYHQTDWLIIVPLILVVALVSLSTIDLYVYRLPNRLVFASLGLSLVAMAVLAVADLRDPAVLLGPLLAGLGYSAFLFVFWLVYPPGMGFGDVKLALLLGAHTGWVGYVYYDDWVAVVQITFWALFVGTLAGVVFSIAMLLIRKFGDRNALADPEAEVDADGNPVETRVRKSAFPFGPSLAIGTFVMVMYPHWAL